MGNRVVVERFYRSYDDVLTEEEVISFDSSGKVEYNESYPVIKNRVIGDFKEIQASSLIWFKDNEPMIYEWFASNFKINPKK